jgi:hypothetical protein
MTKYENPYFLIKQRTEQRCLLPDYFLVISFKADKEIICFTTLTLSTLDWI